MQYPDRLAVIDDVHRPACVVREGQCRVDADRPVECAQHVLDSAPAGGGMLAPGARGPLPPGPFSGRRHASSSPDYRHQSAHLTSLGRP